MKVTFLGHSCFSIEDGKGTRVVTDPYNTGPEFHLREIQVSADVVTISHDHPDHNNDLAISGNPQVLKASGLVKGIKFEAVSAFHDDSGGNERGANLIFVFTLDQIRFCHLGDLGHQLTACQLEAIGPVDVMFVPVGGGFTIDAEGAWKVCADLGGRVIIPMHYKTAGLPFLEDVEAFVRGRDEVTMVPGSVLDLHSDSLPERTSVFVLKPELYTGP